MDKPQPKPGILDIAPYVGGESAIRHTGPVVRLMSNENAFGLSPKAVAAYQDCAANLHHYPSGGHVALREALSARYNLPVTQLVCGNGSDELIQLLCKGYSGSGDEVIYPEHGFLMYPIAAQSVGATVVKVSETDCRVDVDAILAAVTPRTKLVFLANPANPTGTYIGRDALQGLHRGLPPSVLLVLDGAYAEYADAPDFTDGAELVSQSENVAMLRTFSKLHGLAALRVGWGYMPQAVADVLNRIRGPFNVNAPAQAAAVAALADTAHQEKSIRHNAVWRERLTTELTSLGFPVLPSQANFILMETGAATAAVYDFLLQRNIYVRKVASYGLPEHLRVTVGKDNDLQEFMNAMHEFKPK